MLAAQAKRLWQLRYQRYLKSDHWRKFKLTILASRGQRCEQCRSVQKIQIHHLTYIRLGAELPSDVKVLCEACHQKAHDIFQPKRPKWISGLKRVKVRA